jgi:hypothetical protein
MAMSSNNADLRKKCETLLDMIVTATNAVSENENTAPNAASAVADGLYLDIVTAGVKALSDVLKDRQS